MATSSGTANNMLAKCEMLLVAVLLNLLLITTAPVASTAEWELLMPGVTVDEGETYVCYGKPVDTERNHYIVGFNPKAQMETTHHMLLFGCTEPGSTEQIWNCGEMSHSNTNLPLGSPCRDKAQVLYAWARGAPKLELPEDVGFKVGGDSSIKYLVLQVHYAVPVPQPDQSGVIMDATDTPVPKQAGVYLLATGGKVEPGATEHFEAACELRENIDIHPFAYRTHTHELGQVVSGYVVHDGEWTMIGKKNPRLPQMFYPVERDITVSPGDILAARCTMANNRDHTVRIGATNEDEMCNFYVMYWVEGSRLLDSQNCVSFGPPYWYWSQYTDNYGRPALASPPQDASKGDPEEDALAAKHAAAEHH